MGVPKRRTSKSRLRTRRAANDKKRVRKTLPQNGSTCSNCGSNVQSHRVCGSCGHYSGRQVLTVTADA